MGIVERPWTAIKAWPYTPGVPLLALNAVFIAWELSGDPWWVAGFNVIGLLWTVAWMVLLRRRLQRRDPRPWFPDEELVALQELNRVPRGTFEGAEQVDVFRGDNLIEFLRRAVHPDAMTVRHEGLPGLADRCWADVWVENDQTYRTCNAEPDEASELGVCSKHLKAIRP